MRGAKVLSASKAGCRFATGIIIGKAATDAVQGILIAEAFIKEYDEIMKDTDPEKRTSRLITFLGKVSATGAMVIISFKSSADDLQKVGLSKTNLDAAKLGNPSETVDLAAKAKTPGTPDVEVKPQPVKTVDADNPLKLKIDDLMTSDAAQKKLFDLAMKTTDDMDSPLKSIASKYEGAEPISTIKRKDIKDFINEVKIKCAREKYPTVGDMGDMSRGRINLKGAADVVKAKDDIVKMFEGKIEKLKPPREPYPRWHVVIKHDTGLLYEIQIGTHATTTFLEKVIVKLPEAFMKAMGKSKPDIDFHDVMYKGLMKFKGTAIWGKYSMDDFVARYDRILKATGEGVLDDAVNKALQKEIQGILDRIASEDADILKTVFKK
ncbi:MAG: hypothetical protein FJ088_11645 [Deltaproteobacteria bacterium]|nr:hypothetical protein [Deltaproteobacteria bacterium]